MHIEPGKNGKWLSFDPSHGWKEHPDEVHAQNWIDFMHQTQGGKEG